MMLTKFPDRRNSVGTRILPIFKDICGVRRFVSLHHRNTGLLASDQEKIQIDLDILSLPFIKKNALKVTEDVLQRTKEENLKKLQMAMLKWFDYVTEITLISQLIGTN
jgi:hypothetical protein